MPAPPERPVPDRPPDPRWPTAADWLAAGPGERPVDIAVLGVPTYAGSISPTGAHATPAAVRRALRRLSTWCGSRGLDVGRLAAYDLGDVDDPDVAEEGPWRVRTRAAAGAARAPLLFVLGGDNSLTAPVCAGAFADDLRAAGLVTLDAHHDLRAGHSNGSPVRELIAAGLPGRQVAQVGIADWANSRAYAEDARGHGIAVHPRADVEERGITACVEEALDVAGRGGGPVYVDLDLDVCDRSVAPGCPASLPGGLGAGELLEAAFLAGRDPRVRVIDVTEVDATADPDGRTVRLAAMCLLQAVAGFADRRPD